jgi:adenine-specific DNA-methyltransferase
MDKMKFETPDGLDANIEKIAELFPEAVAEGKVNFDTLRTLLGDEVFGDEAYEFTWVGKREAIREAGRPIRKTLRPVVEDETAPSGKDSNGEPYVSSGSKDWDATENLYIEGDNLDVLKLLQESYLGKIKMIYIDPPYNTGNDFVYRDNFTQSRDEYEDEAGVYDEDGERLFKNTESNGRFHSDWCSMIYPRLVLARNLLSNDGVIFISIDDNEVAQLRKICDEIFGESNFVAELIWKSKSGGANDSRFYAVDHEYIIAIAKNANNFSPQLDLEATVTTAYNLEDEHGRYSLDRLDKQSLGYQVTLDFPIIGPDGKEYVVEHKNPNQKVARWRWGKDTVEQRYDELVFRYPYVYTKNYEKQGAIARSLLLEDRFGRTRTGKTDLKALLGVEVFQNPKPYKLLRYLLMITTSTDDMILDFFSGSATTAHAVMQLNAEDGGKRKFIMVQLPEVCADGTEAAKAGYANICEIGKERIRRAGDKIKEEAGLLANDLDVGFRVLKLDDSNMKDVYYAAGEYSQDLLDMMTSNIKDNRTDVDLLYGCLLEWGLPLSLPHTHEEIGGVCVHTYNGGDLIACFADTISEDVVKEIAKRQPLRAVFRDSSFANSPSKINVEEIFKLLAPNTSVKVI